MLISKVMVTEKLPVLTKKGVMPMNRATDEKTHFLDYMELLSRELGVPMEQVTKNGGDSYMVQGRIGEV